VLALASVLLLAGCAPSPDGDRSDPLPPVCGPYRRATPVARYAPETLYEYIDGQAPYVVSFGFVGLATADYRRGDEPVTTVDLYDMGSVENAFALFRSNANLEAQPLEVGAEGAGGDGRIEFWQGRFYVCVSNPAAEEDVHVRRLARLLADALPPTDHLPAYLGWLPAEGRIAGSERFLPVAYLGYEPLKSAVSARYRLAPPADAGGHRAADGAAGRDAETDRDPSEPGARIEAGEAQQKRPEVREVTLFACRYASAEAAGRALADFTSQIAASGGPVPLDAAGLNGLGPEGVVAERFVMGPLVVFRAGRFLAGLLPFADDPATRALLASLAAHVNGL